MVNIFLDFDPIIESNQNENGLFQIADENFHHVRNVLRMHKGDELFASFGGSSHLCVIEKIEQSCVLVKIIQKNANQSELSANVHLFQGLPKGDKMELIIQKAVELGAKSITPVKMKRCVVKLDEKRAKNKTIRYNSIAKSAAEQSKRNIIPKVNEPFSLTDVINFTKNFDFRLACFENEQTSIKRTMQIMQKFVPNAEIALIIGPEGGFEENEIEQLKSNAWQSISLGKRILRTETAAISALTLAMAQLEMQDGSNGT